MLNGKHWKRSSVVLCKKKWRNLFSISCVFYRYLDHFVFFNCPVKSGPISVLGKNLLWAQSFYFDTRMLV